MRILIRPLALLMALVLLMPLLVTDTYAWENEQQALNNLTEDEAAYLATLTKMEKTAAGTVTQTPVSGATFWLFTGAGERIGGPYVTDAAGKISALLPNGAYYWEETGLPDGYDYDQAPSGDIKTYAFEIKDTGAAVTAYNRIKAPEPQTPSDPVYSHIQIMGSKTWDLQGQDVKLPSSITVWLMEGSKKVQEATVTPDAEGTWVYRFLVPQYHADGTRIEYHVEEAPVEGFAATYTGYNIKNTYILPVEMDLPDIIKTVEGEDIPAAEFSFILQAEGDAPMPRGILDKSCELTLSGKGKVKLGAVQFSKAGTYSYTVREVNGGETFWHYDDTVYRIEFVVEQVGAKLTARYRILSGTEEVSSLIFHNRYQVVDLQQTILLSGQKTWRHLDNPVKNQPDHIIVEVYSGTELVLQRRVTEADAWTYVFELPQYDAAGQEILYRVDEAAVAGYLKRIEGYDIINTYLGEEDEKEGTGQPSGAATEDPKNDPPKTGDDFDLRRWLYILGGSFIALVSLIILYRKTKS